MSRQPCVWASRASPAQKSKEKCFRNFVENIYISRRIQDSDGWYIFELVASETNLGKKHSVHVGSDYANHIRFVPTNIFDIPAALLLHFWHNFTHVLHASSWRC